MDNGNVLYKIKTLEKTVFRNILSSSSDIEKSMPKLTQMQIIDYMLAHINEDVYQKDLEATLGLKRATLSGVLQTMEKNGLIVRVISDNDTRVKKVILSENARDIFFKNCDKFRVLESVITNNISKHDLKVFLRVIDKMISNIERRDI